LDQGYVYIKSTVTKLSIEIAVNLFNREKKTHTHDTNSCKQENR